MVTSRLVDRWKKKSIITSEGCWRYYGQLSKRHPRIKFKGELHGLNRISAHIFLGMNLHDRNQQANHKRCCPHKDCWNPEHLYVGTQYENVCDALAIGTHRSPFIKEK
jgi:hypothetical protein